MEEIELSKKHKALSTAFATGIVMSQMTQWLAEQDDEKVEPAKVDVFCRHQFYIFVTSHPEMTENDLTDENFLEFVAAMLARETGKRQEDILSEAISAGVTHITRSVNPVVVGIVGSEPDTVPEEWVKEFGDEAD